MFDINEPIENCTRGNKPMKIVDLFTREFEGLWFLLGIPGITLAIGLFIMIVKCLRNPRMDRNLQPNEINMEISSRPSSYKTEISVMVNSENDVKED